MPNLAPLFPIILATHITLAVALFVPSLLLPFTLRNRLVNVGYQAPEPGRFVRALLWAQAHGTIVIGAGLAITGLSMIAVLGTRMLEQPWPRSSPSRSSAPASADCSGVRISRPRPIARPGARGPAANGTSPTGSPPPWD
jgi:hypothetical protein